MSSCVKDAQITNEIDYGTRDAGVARQVVAQSRAGVQAYFQLRVIDLSEDGNRRIIAWSLSPWMMQGMAANTRDEVKRRAADCGCGAVRGRGGLRWGGCCRRRKATRALESATAGGI